MVLIFVVLFWMNSGYVWLTNQVPPNGATRRLLLFGGMVAFLACALSIPEAFGDTEVTFGLGYLLVVVVHAGLYAETHGSAVLRFVALNIVGALSVIVAGFVEGPAAYALWLVPIVFQYLTSIFVMGSVNEERRAGFDVHPEHFVERHGLLLIVAFGESVVAIGIGIGDEALDLGTLGAALLGLPGASPRLIRPMRACSDGAPSSASIAASSTTRLMSYASTATKTPRAGETRATR